MRNFPSLPLLAVVFGVTGVPAFAQDMTTVVSTPEEPAEPPVDEEDARQGSDIVVVATRIRGQVDAPQAPVATFDEAQIAALGASSITDVLAQISPQTGSGRGRGGGMPVMLVNGQRISSFREMRNYPPEAIRKIEVLPEEVALRYGFPADVRVVNMILKDDFRSTIVEAEIGQPDRGGTYTGEVEVSQLTINGPNRLNITGHFEKTGMLTEAERGVVQESGNVPTVALDPDPAAYSSLIADSREMSLNASWSRGLGKDGLGGQLSLNGTVTRSDTLSLSGLDLFTLTGPTGASERRALSDPLERRSRTTTVEGGAGYNTRLGDWQLTATVDVTHAEGTTLIDRRADTSALVAAAAAGTLGIAAPLPSVSAAGQDRTTTNSDRIESLVTLVGRPLDLPAGSVNLTVKGGYTWLDYATSDSRSVTGPVSLHRNRIVTGANLGIPLTSRRENALAALGDISLNFSAGYNDLSDFGGLFDWSAGLTWSPVEGLGLQASYLVNEAAPGLSELGSPQTLTYNVPVYDFTTGQTTLVTVTGGGNPALLKEKQRDIKLSANWQLPFLSNSSLLVEYFRNKSNNVTASFPLLTPAIEAAFPSRVVRDASGTLISIDRRPVTLAEQTGERLRWGFNLGGTLGKPSAQAAPGQGRFPGMPAGGGMRAPGGAGGPPPGLGGGRPGGGPGMRGMMGGGNGQGRWNLGLYHTVQFNSEVLVAPGGPILDLLNGDALTTGGTPRHSVELNGGTFYRGFGMFVQGTWSSPTRVRATGAPGSSDLRFGSVAKINLNVFADLGQQQKLVKQAPFFKDSRMSLRFENVLDSRQRVTDANGDVPLSYQPDYLDPKGRFIEIEFRKRF